MAAAAGTRLGTGYVEVEPDFSRFQEVLGKRLNQALAPAFRKAGSSSGKELAKGIDTPSFTQALKPLTRRFSKVGDEAGKEIAAKIGRGAQKAKGDMFGLAEAVAEVEKRNRKASRSSKQLGGDMFGVAKAARDAGKGLAFSANRAGDWQRRADGATKSTRNLFGRIRGLGYEFGGLSKRIRTSSGGFSGFDGVMARVNRGSQFFRNIWRTIRWPAIIAGVGLTAQGLSALAAGAVAATSALGPLGGALIALPAAAVAAAQAFSVLKLATAGVGDAVKAALAAEVEGGTQAIDTMRQQEDAAERVADAKRNLIDVQRQALTAQEDLTQARADARRELEDMRMASERSHDSEQGAVLSLKQARQELARTMADPKASGLDIRFAEEAVDQARHDLEQTRIDAERARQDYRKAQKAGVEGMPQVVSAKQAEADANRAVTDAQRDLERASRDATAAMEEQGAAASALQDKMSQLPVPAQKFVRLLVSLKPRLDALRDAAAGGFFPGAERGLKGLMGNFKEVRGIVGKTAGVLGGIAAKAGKKLGSAVWGKDLTRLGKTNARILDRMGDAGLNLADALRHVLVAAEPFLDWLSESTLQLTGWMKEESAAGRRSGALAEFFDRTRDTMERLGPILKGVGGALLNIGEAARPLGNQILDSLGDAAEGWRRWTDSTRGQNRLKQYFTETKPAIFEMGRLIRDAGKAFFELGRQRGVAELLRLVRTGLIPALRDLVGATTGWAAEFLRDFKMLRDEGVPAFDALVQALVDHAVQAGGKIAKALVSAFFNSGPLGKLFVGGWLLTKFGGGGALFKIGGVIGRYLGFGIAGGAGDGLQTAAKGPLRSRLLSLGKGLGVAFAAYGFFEGARTAFSDSKGAKSLSDHLHNTGVGFFRSFGINLGETTAEQFSNGFKKRVTTLSNSGALGVQSIITPDIEQRAREKAEAQVDEKYPGRQGSGLTDVPEFDLLYQKALSGLMRSVQARRASTKDLFRDFWEDMGPDERTFAKQLRNALVQGDRLLRQTSVKLPEVRLQVNPQQAGRATKRILSDFTFLRKGIGANAKDIGRVSKRAGQLIVETFGRGTKEARELTARNLRVTALAFKQQMVRSGDYTEEGWRRIEGLIRNARLLDPTRKQARAFGEEWAKGMDRSKEVTAKGMNAMIREANKLPGPMKRIALETWFEHVRQARKSGDLTADAFRKLRSRMFSEFGTIQRDSKAFNREFGKSFVDMVNESGGAMGILMSNLSSVLGAVAGKGKLDYTIKKAKAQGAEQQKQTGGFIVPGRGSGDKFKTMLPAGSFILNREATAAFGFQEGGMMPVALEPKERVFMPNEVARRGARRLTEMNQAVPRKGYQEGGRLGPEPQIAGPTGALRLIGQQAVKKVYEGAQSFLKQQSARKAMAGGISGDGDVETVFARVAKQFSKSITATLALGMAGFTESGMRDLGYGDSSSEGALQLLASTASSLGIDPHDEGAVASHFLLRGYWGKGGANSLAARGLPAHMVAQSVQGSGTYDGSNYLAQEGPAKQWMRRFGLDRAGGRLKGLMEGGRVGALMQRLSGGGMVDVPGDGGSGVVNPSIVDLVAAYAKKFNASINYGYDPSGHVSPGHLTTGTATDTSPRDGVWTGSYEDGLRLLVSKGFEVGYGTDGIGEAWPNHGRGNHAHIEWVGNGTASDARQKLRADLGSVTGTTAAPAGPSAPPKEKVPATFKGAKTGNLDFGPLPKTLEKVKQELEKWNKEKRVYTNAKREAEKIGKPETAERIGRNLSKIVDRLRGLEQLRSKLHLAKVRDKLSKRFGRVDSRFGNYEQIIERSQLGYEKASQLAEQVVGLEPQSPEIVQAKGESDKAFDSRREQAERAYVAQYSGYIEGPERKAFGDVLGQVAGWRNNILRAEMFGFGKGQPSVSASGSQWEGEIKGVRHRIAKINEFIVDIRKRVADFRQNGKSNALPEGLKQKIADREEMRKELPILRLKDTRLSEAVVKARELFYPGRKNPLSELPEGTRVQIPLEGSGSLEEKLREVQGIHGVNEWHNLLSPEQIGTVQVPGNFGGVIWDLQGTISELGLKIRQATNGIAGAGGDSEEGTEDNSELASLLRQIAERERKGRYVSERLASTTAGFDAFYGDLPKFHSGGVTPGPEKREFPALLKGHETVRTAEQEIALAEAIRDGAASEGGGGDVLFELVVKGDIVSDHPDPVELVLRDPRTKRFIQRVPVGRVTAGGARG